METVQTSYMFPCAQAQSQNCSVDTAYKCMKELKHWQQCEWLCWTGVETVQTSYLMRTNGPAWRRLLLSCRKNTQQVRAGTNCGYYCSLASHHQGRTPGSTSGSSNSWRQAVIDARSYLIRFYTDFRWVSQCCNSYKLLHTLPTSPLWYSRKISDIYWIYIIDIYRRYISCQPCLSTSLNHKFFLWDAVVQSWLSDVFAPSINVVIYLLAYLLLVTLMIILSTRFLSFCLVFLSCLTSFLLCWMMKNQCHFFQRNFAMSFLHFNIPFCTFIRIQALRIRLSCILQPCISALFFVSCIFHPYLLVPVFHPCSVVLHFPVLHFCPIFVIFQSCIFSWPIGIVAWYIILLYYVMLSYCLQIWD